MAIVSTETFDKKREINWKKAEELMDCFLAKLCWMPPLHQNWHLKQGPSEQLVKAVRLFQAALQCQKGFGMD
jgi:hypothetical protein